MYRECLLYIIILSNGTIKIIRILIMFILKVLIIGSKFSNKLTIIFIGLVLVLRLVFVILLKLGVEWSYWIKKNKVIVACSSIFLIIGGLICGEYKSIVQ